MERSAIRERCARPNRRPGLRCAPSGLQGAASLPEDAFDVVEHALRRVPHELIGIVPQRTASGWAAEVVFDDIDPGKKARWFFFAGLVNFAQTAIDPGG
jgi:hypothetical protein